MSRPTEPTPFGAPGDAGVDPQNWMRAQLFDRRIVLLSGELDDQAANAVGVELMTLDALGDEAVTLQVDSGQGTVAAALSLMDVVDLLGVPVRAMGLGQVCGPALGVFARCAHRTVSPHARLRLFEPPVEVEGNAAQLQQLAELHSTQWSTFCARLAQACGRAVDAVLSDADAGRFFDAAEAVAYGLADDVASPSARMYRLPGRPMGFGAR